jgi:hypothetical protein
MESHAEEARTTAKRAQHLISNIQKLLILHALGIGTIVLEWCTQFCALHIRLPQPLRNQCSIFRDKRHLFPMRVLTLLLFVESNESADFYF